MGSVVGRNKPTPGYAQPASDARGRRWFEWMSLCVDYTALAQAGGFRRSARGRHNLARFGPFQAIMAGAEWPFLCDMWPGFREMKLCGDSHLRVAGREMWLLAAVD